MSKSFGFKLPDIDPKAYILGAFDLPKIVVRKDGDWSAFLPTYEPQFNEYWDSNGCTVWGTENAIEILVKALTGIEKNTSERYIYNLAGINFNGADPHYIAEIIREYGLIDETILPMVSSKEEFITPRPMTQRYIDEGKRFQFSIKHAYVWNGSISKEERTKKIRECLQYSPLGVSVTAWYKDGDVYIDKGKPNTHWCVLFGEDKNGWKIFDSYDQSIKILSFDHNIEVCKRYMIVKKEEEKATLIEIIKKTIEVIRQLINLKKENQKSIADIAEERLHTDITPLDSVSDEVACAEVVSTLIRLIKPSFPIISGTYSLLTYLSKNASFKAIQENECERGTIILCATSTGNGSIRGHVGIYDGNGMIISNSSKSGLLEKNYTFDQWKLRYEKQGGFKTRYFNMV